ncbi:hypothetical protein CLOSTMETH_03565 [[Clostridium] methylpentosum DSM 5476]|uniref:Uncharacterized protein n=1 Tax=[Clostridium] methylpentosum DSM 5476 TaxID=537013 RepID=C0EI70_9FIRM|nr:hypothetical protein CLOSTMETH_03565 [[Clostridium] methylpentosum DSM 5476]
MIVAGFRHLHFDLRCAQKPVATDCAFAENHRDYASSGLLDQPAFPSFHLPIRKQRKKSTAKLKT